MDDLYLTLKRNILKYPLKTKQRNTTLERKIFSISNASEFNDVALDVFAFQFEHVPVYKGFCQQLGITNPKEIKEIPFLPISFFKSHEVISEGFHPELTFKSSGTTGMNRSQHLVPFTELYETSFRNTFEHFFGKVEQTVVLGLLPNYLEQGDSSLVYMVDNLIASSKSDLSGFFLNNYDELIVTIKKAKQANLPIVLIGVSYALMDLADRKQDFSGVKVIETGGMKGRRKEMLKEELHAYLKEGLNVDNIYAEYGMTELLSQAYLLEDLWFQCPNWMSIVIRDTNDPLAFLNNHKTGGVNVIDLANLYSCAFIATDDLGQINDRRFKIIGRFDNSDIRGCNLLVG